MVHAIEQYHELVEKEAWGKYESARYLYHLTPVFSIDDAFSKKRKICDEGLIAGETQEGENPAIWFFVDQKYACSVAASILVRHFALFRVKKSEVPRHLLKWDNVAEYCARVSFYAEIECVRNVQFVGFYMPKPQEEWD